MPVELLAMPEEEKEQEKKSYPAYDVHTLENVIDGVVCVFEEGRVVTDTIQNLKAKQVLRNTVTQTLNGIRENLLSQLIKSLPDSDDRVKLNDEIWFNMLPKAPDLCYISLSGRFDRKGGYTISTRTARLPINTAFRIIPPEKHKPNLYPFTIYDGKIIAYSRLFATPLVRSMIQAAAQEGSDFYDGLSVEHYSNFPLSGSILSNTGFGPPGQNPFCYMICSIMDRENIDSNKFMERTRLDYNIYNNLRNNPSYKPKEPTAKAILFAVRPTVLDAVSLYGLAGYQFQQTVEDLLLLTFFANADYDIEKYNEVIKSKGCTPLGSKSYSKKISSKTK